MKRNMRRIVEVILTLIGILIIFGSVLFVKDVGIQVQFGMVLIGVLLMEAGVWGLSSRLLPNERKFVRLRDEGDRMIMLIRELNANALIKDSGAKEAQQFQETLAEMHDCVAIMSDLAGQQGEPPQA